MMAIKPGKSRATVSRMMREVHENIPSTVKRAKRFGKGGKEAMLRAVALSKSRKAGAHVPYKGIKRG